MSDESVDTATAGADAAVPTRASVEVPTSADAPAPPPPSPSGWSRAVTPITQEVRFATAMTGGVSLAIWMGGVARELNLLDRASREREGDDPAGGLGPEDAKACQLYRSLLDLLDQVVRIDVLSGTSAGGINAALLGLCHARGVDLGLLRDIWLETGAFDTLLRDPTVKDPPSLMQGDAVLLAGLGDGIGRLVGQQGAALPRETTAYVTTSLLTGETSRFTDTYGTVVPDVDHLAVFTFPTKAFSDPTGLDALALAARASASFPAAFEPAFLPFRSPAKATAGPTLRPAMAPYANITRAHWAADGGLLANRPLEPLLQSVFERPADDREVRRVLLYIVPDPGGSPDARLAPEEERVDQPYTLGHALVSDLGATLNQSISAELEAIRRHNDRVDSVRDTRLRLVELGSAGVPLTSEAGRADFVRRESEAFVRLVVDRLMREVTSRPDAEMTEAWTLELAPGRTIEETCRAEARRRVSRDWDPAPAPGDYAALGRLGRVAYEAALSTALGLVRAGYVLAPVTGRTALSHLSTRLHDAFRPTGQLDLDQTIRTVLDESVAGDGRGEPAATLPDVAAEVAARYAADRALGTTLFCDADLEEIEPPAGVPEDCLARAWWTLAGLVDEAVPLLEGLTEEADDPADPAPEVAQAAPDPATPVTDRGPKPPTDPRTRTGRRERARYTLVSYLRYLGTGRDQIASRLLALHVAERSMLPARAFVEQAVELVQVSANTRTLLAPAQATAHAKLTGTQFHHFGAFYKSSWRANDWLWGRVDGAGWLVHVLLDPRRILNVVDADAGLFPPRKRAEAFLGRLETLAGPRAERTERDLEYRDEALEELRFLDDRTREMPTSLPSTALWVASAWQRWIAAAELPVVAREIIANPSRRDDSWAMGVLRTAGAEDAAVAASRQAVAAVLSGRSARRARQRADEAAEAARRQAKPLDDRRATALAEQLATCPVPHEKLAQEVGEPLLTRTLSKTVAVGTATISSIRKPPASLAALLATARTVTLTGYRAIGIAGATPKRLVLGGVAASAVGLALAVQHSTMLGLTGSVLLLAGLYLIALGAWGLRGGVLAALGAATVVTMAVVACLPWTRDQLFGTGEADEPGWVTKTLVPWLRDAWWGLLAVIGIVLALATLWIYAVRFAADRRAVRQAREGGGHGGGGRAPARPARPGR